MPEQNREEYIMNEVIKTIQNHRSIRSYTGEDVKEEHLNLILKSAMHAPSSINGQQWKIIIVKDQAKKDKIAELTGGQAWISKSSVFMLFVMDYQRVAKEFEKRGLSFENIRSVEAIMVGSVDVGLAFGNAMNAAESLGYGIVPIGAVRRKPMDIIELLELPQYVYPVLGMCIGLEEGDQALKPRLPYEAYVSVDRYETVSDEIIASYDSEIKNYMLERTDGKDDTSWLDRVTSVYSKVYFPEVYDSLKKQGFKNEC